MHILVDARHLIGRQHSGVGEYTIELLRVFFKRTDGTRFTLLSTGMTEKPLLPKRLADCFSHDPEIRRKRRRTIFLWSPYVRHVHIHTPNKWLNVRAVAKHAPTLPQLAGVNPDICFLPNINITPADPDTPTVLTVHDCSWKLFPEFYSTKMRLWHRLSEPHQLIGGASAIITPSESTKRDLLRQFDREPTNIRTIPHGISSGFRPRMEATDHGIRSKYRLPSRFVLFLGTIEPRKNVDALIEAMQRYRTAYHDDIQLVLAGKRGWKTKHVRHHLRADYDWLHEYGYVPAAHRAALYRAATLFAWPSFYEGFGLPPLEAMACGTPVIASHTASLPEVVGDAGILINPHDIQDIVDALAQTLSARTLRDRLGARGVERAKHFSWKATADATMECFESI